MRLSHRSSGPPRQGVILLVVVLMLALFLVVGLAFVLYSESAATASRINREAQTPDLADVLPETLLTWALGQLIYDVPDDISGVPSAMRGHSLARTMYGWNWVQLNGTLQPDPTKTNSAFDSTYGTLANTTPFNGLGPLQFKPPPAVPSIALPPALANVPNLIDYNLVNYTWFQTSGDGFVRDPERAAWRGGATQTTLNPFTGGFNAPYTYPGRNNMFLAAVQANNGQPKLLAQSFNPPGSAFGTFASSNPNWTNTVGKYLTLRPRPADHSAAFPYPQDLGGDVKQLPGVLFYVNGQQVQNDSFWMDLNYPVQISRNGKKFKPLFAFLVLDLDGRINLNMHGNVNAGQNTSASPYQHASNHGLGRPEVNVSAVLTATTVASSGAATAEWPQLFVGYPQTLNGRPQSPTLPTPPTYAGRFGQDETPGYLLNPNNAIPDLYALDSTNGLPFRSLLFPLDCDAVDLGNNRAVTTKFNLPLSPNAAGQASFASYPQFSATGYDNYIYPPTATSPATQAAMNPRLNHPLLDQKLRAFGDDQPFGNDNMYWLLANDYRKSYLYNLIPNNLGGPNPTNTAAGNYVSLGNQVRQLITTTSFELDVPGAPPWVTSSAASQYVLNGTTSIVNSTAPNYPTGQPMLTPAPAQIAAQTPAAGDYSDFKPNDGRANLLSRVDLNRKLTPYNDSTGKFNGGLQIPAPVAASSLSPGLLTVHPEYRYYVATNDRQQLAQDIFNRLVQATGAMSPDTVGPPVKLGSLHQANGATAQNYAATRWLAQLAVNIVDYVDDDDIMTPFNWNPSPDAAISGGDTGWVYGVEAPNLVVNEAYCEVANDPTDTNAGIKGAQLPYQYNFWLELYNPMSVANPPAALTTPTTIAANPNRADLNKYPQSAPTLTQDRMAVQLQRQSTTLNSNYPVYQIMIVNETGQNSSPPTWLAQPSNTDGSIGQTPAVVVQVTSYMPDLNAQATAPANAPTPYPDYTFVQPNIGAFNIPTTAGPTIPNNTGFYVIGPDSKHLFFQQQQTGGVTLRPTLNLQNQQQTPQQSVATPWGQAPKAGVAKNALTYSASPNSPSPNPASVEGARTHTVLLRRLACPNLDPNPFQLDQSGNIVRNPPQTGQPVLVNSAKPYNPYITVDYITGVPTNDAVQYISQRPFPPNTPNNPDWINAPKNPNQRHSIGRVQPYNAAVTKQQTSSAPNPVNNTFFSHNSQTPPAGPSSASTSANNQPGQPTLDWPFDWLTFADRPLTNVAEVMNVPTTYPHMLTHAFGFNPTTKQRDLSNHLAPWSVQDARIYRALEFFTVGDRAPYPATGARVAGKINVNTVFDAATIAAAADPQANSNFFTQQALNDVWFGLDYPQALTNTAIFTDTNNHGFLNRKQALMGLGTNPDKPFMSMAAPVVAANTDPQYPASVYPTGVGIQNTILPYPIPAAAGGQPTPGGTFTPQTWPQGNPPGTPQPGTPASVNYTIPTNSGEGVPPFIMNELLTKISGHTTTRSNTFAVFLTVGFFEVVDDTTLPVKLGAELTTAGGKNLRHQMFSIVDRTNLAIDPSAPTATSTRAQQAQLLATNPNAGTFPGRLMQAATPPVFMSLQESLPAGTGTTAAPATVHVVGGVPTDYDGNAPVTFAANQIMFLDMGATQEQVIVNQSVDSTGTPVLQLSFGATGAKFNHPPGAMLCNYQPGNPGPQGPIDYTSPQYRAVVPYTYIVQ